jgi:RNA polymerase sigma factor (sigma-70 family)
MENQSRQPLDTRYSLLSRLRNWDDEKSWRDFFDMYWQLIYHAALKSGLTEAEAQDVVQETVMAVARDIDKFKRQPELGSFKGWLRNIVRWRIGDQLRQRGARPPDGHFEPEAGQPAAEGARGDSPFERIWDQEWAENLIAAAVARLKLEVKEENFQIFDLLALQGVPVEKVCKRLGIARARLYLVKHRVAKLFKKQIQQLEKEGF